MADISDSAPGYVLCQAERTEDRSMDPKLTAHTHTRKIIHPPSSRALQNLVEGPVPYQKKTCGTGDVHSSPQQVVQQAAATARSLPTASPAKMSPRAADGCTAVASQYTWQTRERATFGSGISAQHATTDCQSCSACYFCSCAVVSAKGCA